ncbi:MAG: hypothetical protein JJT94_08690 [Bernardetiaceae bacterium]|nr:hypothetical protein [Bernardetiaceae bacterium]
MDNPQNTEEGDNSLSEKAPFLGQWRNIYALLLIELLLLMSIFYWITSVYR